MGRILGTIWNFMKNLFGGGRKRFAPGTRVIVSVDEMNVRGRVACGKTKSGIVWVKLENGTEIEVSEDNVRVGWFLQGGER